MTAPTVPSASAPAALRTTGVGRSVRDSLVITKCNLIRVTRVPGMIIFMLVQPVLFVVMFSYVFGGSMQIGGTTDSSVYREFLMVGIFAQTVIFATVATSAGIADDMRKGLVDRFRALPMARGAVLTGRTLADLVQMMVTMVVLATVGSLVGWRIHEGALKAAAAFGLLLLLGYAFTWVGALTGMLVGSPEAASSGGMMWIIPVTFISNAFVDPGQMTPWLRHVADWNPFSATVQACRELFGNPGVRTSDVWPMEHAVEASLLYSIVIIAICRTLAVRKYRNATS
ncbi:ABC transporter permease [Actinomadura soli]|uniref:Transport permease protein n=1 Tax=Actinomadura soli TaxID=2508997 RepID=A0A5C4JIP9_9ACTN|nr:ABC transporter permease [Actinomadura soli]TMR06732.1 ABC transporter permease [Actinomadura soli]